MHTPRRYDSLASWFHLLTAPVDYADEAADMLARLRRIVRGELRSALELGSGGGNSASHLKASLSLTLVDRAPGMLALSRRLNPECEHREGDMRSIRLGRSFDAVIVHDAIMYMTDEQQLRAVMDTAFAHCRPGGAAIFLPDCVRETFTPETCHGGHDDEGGRGMRYVEWRWDPDPADTHYEVAFAYLLREADGRVRSEQDHDRFGLFPRATWTRLLAEAGFRPEEAVDPWERVLFLGARPL